MRARGVLCTNAFLGSEAARHLGPTPRGRLKFGRILACWTQTTQNRRVQGAHRSATGPLSAASARDMRPSARERVPWPVRRMACSRMYTIHTTLHTHADDRVHVRRGPLRRWVITSGLMRGECVLLGQLRSRSSFGPNSTRPAQIWPYTCLPDPNHSEPARAGRTSVCNRAVECRFRPRSPGGPRASARERVPWPVLRMARSWLYTIHTTLQTHANDRVHAKRALQREGRAEKTRWILRFHCGSCFRCTYWEHEW